MVTIFQNFCWSYKKCPRCPYLLLLIYSSRSIKQNQTQIFRITHSILRIEDNESIMCGFYSIAFIEYMLAGKSLSDYTNLFSPNDYKRMTK